MPLQKSNILIVDDIVNNFQVLAYSLKKAGYTLTFSSNGPDAIKNVHSKHFDLILLDIMMPGMDGYEVCRILKADDKTSQIPIIFITAKTDSQSLIHAFDLGAVDYITKPFKFPEILARVKTHITLKNTTKELMNSNAMKDKLLSIIAHDLRGPIGNFGAAIELLLDGYNDFDANFVVETLEEIQKSASGVNDLLQNLLEWANCKNEVFDYNPHQINLNAIILSTINLLEGSASLKSITINFDSLIHVLAFADENMVSTIIRNLLSNAIKYSHPKSIVKLEISSDENAVKVSVVDQGVGIDAEKMKMIFLSEHIQSTYGTLNEKGTGLGLKLCKDFVEKNKGVISVESEVGLGSVFSFSLPIEKTNHLIESD